VTMDYKPQEIEPKWQEFWEKNNLFRAEDFSKKPKKYILVEFPYPSGDGLHVGHARSYSALDAIARKKRMEGYNVLFPIGWDAFGLPTENYAIKTGIHPKKVTEENTSNFKKQLKSLGLSFDWSREINTTDPEYYKWTQWIFLKLFEKGLAYQAEIPVNWCPSCKIGLANEEVAGGACERCGTTAERRVLKQWMLKITAYADRLIDDLEKVDYLDKIKTQQINWIGKSYGTEIDFQVESSGKKIPVFTTRIDTIFSGTFIILAPEHQLVKEVATKEQKNAVEKYVKETAQKGELERSELEKERTGVFTGAYAINPANNEKMPIWIADFVLAHYGTGAVFADAHDQRDF
jgi:leucyl-tRNA synthetase